MTRAFLLIFLPTQVFAQSVLISEVFANAEGRSKDEGKEWIELYNQAKPIDVLSLDLEIYEQKGQIWHIAKESYTPKSSLKFSKFLILATSPDLGIKACIDEEIPVVVMPFSIKNAGAKKICVSINGERSCASFSKKSPMPDGTALFRDLDDRSEEPLWRHEPCRFLDIFASPGQPPRYFCTNQNQTCSDGQTLSFRPIKKGQAGPNIYSLCKAVKESQTSCHIIERQISTAENPGVFTKSYLLKPDEELFLLTKRFDGTSFKAKVALARPAQKWPTINVLANNDKKSLAFTLEALQAPLNLSIFDKNGAIIWQQSFVEPGFKTIDLFSKETDLWLKMCDISGEHLSMPLGTKAKTH